MNINVVAHNLLAMNGERNLGINSRLKTKNMEKLSSGYRINRAADDAAGLAISQKLRRQIRTLNQGTANSQDGVSWVQIGDGALNEVHDMLHRMTELAIKSLNGTNTDEDREYMEAEFDKLQSEIDHVTDSAVFNEKNVFLHHEPTYYQLEGNAVWPISQLHKIDDSNNSLTVKYTLDDETPEKTITFSVPNGTYTSQELADEIEDAILAHSDAGSDGLYMEFTEKNTFNLNLEGGKSLGEVTGGLSYLLYETYQGGSGGILIGTTIFTSDTTKLPIVAGKNDEMTFTIEDLDGQKTSASIKLNPGYYTRDQLIDILNEKLEGMNTTVRASRHGTGIQMGSDEEIVSQFKGNMFTIDGPAYTSVFYDNVYHGDVEFSAGTFTGGKVILTNASSNSKDLEHQYFEIVSGVNDTLTFQPNTDETPTTLTINAGKYTLTEMISTLNGLFTSKNLDLTASRTSTEYTGGHYFAGIIITSGQKGIDSKVGLDKANSSAYDTLFVERKYNVYTNDGVLTNDRASNQYAYFIGSKSFDESSTAYDNLPLTIQSGLNDKFAVNINGTAYTVTVAAGTYNTIDDLLPAVNNALNSDLGAYSGKVSADKATNTSRTSYSNYSDLTKCIILKAVNYSDNITDLTASAISGNSGYAELFTTSTKLTYSSRSGSSTSSTTVGTFPEPVTISSPNNILRISASSDSSVYNNLDLAGENLTHDQIINIIESDPNNVTKTVTFNNTCSISTNSGTSTSNNFTSSATSGSDGKPATTSVSAFGVTSTPGKTEGAVEGQAGVWTTNTPASVTFTLNGGSFAVDGSSNTVNLTLNGSEKTFTFTSPSYTAQSFAAELNTKLGNDATVTCTSSGSRYNIKITCALSDTRVGADTSVSIDTGSSLLQKANTVVTPATEATAATCTTNRAMLSSITVAAGSTFTFTTNTGTHTVNLDAKTNCTRDQFVSMLNTKLGAYGVTASNASGYLKLTTTEKSGSASVNFSSSNGGTSVEGIFGPITTESRASSTSTAQLQNDIIIESGKQKFTYVDSGGEHTIQLDVGQYSRTGFVQMLNQKLDANNAKIDAYLATYYGSTNTSGTYLKLISTDSGTSAKAGMKNDCTKTYTADGSAMPAIWGTYQVTVPRVEASFGGDDGNELQLKSTVDGKTFTISAQTGSGVVQPTRTDTTNPNTQKQTGVNNTTPASLDGVDLTISESRPLVIDEWNDDLKFAYYKCDNEKYIQSRSVISIQVAHGTYTSYSQLQNELQTKLDEKAGSGELKATVDEHGVRIEAVTPGNKRAIKDPVNVTQTSGQLTAVTSEYKNNFGDFYDKVMCTNREELVNQVPSNKDGSNFASEDKVAYTIGRKDIRNTQTKIVKDVNDTLSLDFSYKDTGNNTHSYTFNMKLDPGSYSGGQLVDLIQEKLDDELDAAGLERGTIEVAVGKIHNNVAGSNNDNALNFILSDKTKLPGEGEYVIDGIGGNAAFSVFYQTEGELVPAYVYGVKDISSGVTIEEEKNILSFETEGTDYQLEIPAGDYTADEIITTLNDLLKAQNAPVKAELDENGRLKLSQKKMGKHPINSIAGSARSTLMFNEYHDDEKEAGIYIKPSAVDEDRVKIDRPNMSTAALGINTVTISKDKYTNKALGRLKEALNKVSSARSYFGATQNRLEHLIANNNNASENTSAADSRLADTDMAKESVALALANIREQVSQSILAQANQANQNVLSLLNG